MGERAIAGLQGVKGAAFQLFRRHAAPWLWVRPRDRWMHWSLPVPAEGDGPRLDILRIGSCEDRAMPDNHQADGPLGYPRFLVRALHERGISAGYQNMWIWTFEELPRTERELLKRRRLNRPAPHVILFQVGPIYTGKHFLGAHRRIIGLRENMGRRIGPLIYPVWRVLGAALRIAGFSTYPYPGTAQLDQFLDVVTATWPDTVVAVYEPTTPAIGGGIDRRKDDDLRTDLRAVCDCHGPNVRWMPTPDLGLDMRLRISNGYNLNESGSRVVGRYFAEWMLAQPGLVKGLGLLDASAEPHVASGRSAATAREAS